MFAMCFSTPKLLKMYFGAPDSVNLFSGAAFELACFTLMTVAQSLHTSGNRCACDFNMMEEGIFALSFMQHIALTLPTSSNSELPLSQRRAKYAFGQLEHALRSLEQAPEPLVRELQGDRRSLSAAKMHLVIIRRHERLSYRIRRSLGPGDNLVTPLNSAPIPSLTSAFIGRPGKSCWTWSLCAWECRSSQRMYSLRHGNRLWHSEYRR